MSAKSTPPVTFADMNESGRHRLPEATVVWTRYQRNEHAIPDVLAWFERHGFELLGTSVPDGTNLCVGVHRLIVESQTLRRGQRLFTFVDERTDDHWRLADGDRRTTA